MASCSPVSGPVRWSLDDRSRAEEYANSSVEVLDAATGRVLHTLIGHTEAVVGIAFSPDGRRIATASFDRTVKLWDTATGREVFTLRGHTAGLLVLAFSPDGRRIVSGGIDFTARVWDATPLPAEVLQAQECALSGEANGTSASWTTEAEKSSGAANIWPWFGQWDLAAAAIGKSVEPEPRQPRASVSAHPVAPGGREHGREFGAPAKTCSRDSATRPIPCRPTASSGPVC